MDQYTYFNINESIVSHLIHDNKKQTNIGILSMTNKITLIENNCVKQIYFNFLYKFGYGLIFFHLVYFTN